MNKIRRRKVRLHTTELDKKATFSDDLYSDSIFTGSVRRFASLVKIDHRGFYSIFSDTAKLARRRDVQRKNLERSLSRFMRIAKSFSKDIPIVSPRYRSVDEQEKILSRELNWIDIGQPSRAEMDASLAWTPRTGELFLPSRVPAADRVLHLSLETPDRGRLEALLEKPPSENLGMRGQVDADGKLTLDAVSLIAPPKD